MDSSKKSPANIDEYIEIFPDEIKRKLYELRKFINKLVPEAEEVISYRMPTFDLEGKHLVYFAGYKNHIGFYPYPSGIEAFKEESKNYVTSKGTVQFPYDKPIPFELIEKMVKFRIKEVKNP